MSPVMRRIKQELFKQPIDFEKNSKNIESVRSMVQADSDANNNNNTESGTKREPSKKRNQSLSMIDS